MLTWHERVVALVSVLAAEDGTWKLRDVLNAIDPALLSAQYHPEDVIPLGPQQLHEFGVSCPHKFKALLAICPEYLAQYQGPVCPERVLATTKNIEFCSLHINLEQE